MACDAVAGLALIGAPVIAASVLEVPLAEILPLRDEYRRAKGCQIVHDSWHARGFTRCYLLCGPSGESIGYGAVGGAPRETADIVKEFWLQPAERAAALRHFRALVTASGARRVEAQTNDPFLFPLLADVATGLASETIIFADRATTRLVVPGAGVRPLGEADRARVFPHEREPVGEWVVEWGDEIVATGGLATHYNPPYQDIYMEVAPARRCQGFGSFLVQELKRICYGGGGIPAARCNETNRPSQATLERAGMAVCGRIVRGQLAQAVESS